MKPRSCGACQACCVVLSVPEIAKPDRQTCPSQCAKGCAAYEARPEPCRGYSCFWLAYGFGEARDRPDRLGVIFDGAVDEATIRASLPDLPPGPIAIAREVRRGSLASRRAMGLAHALSERAVVIFDWLGARPSSGPAVMAPGGP